MTKTKEQIIKIKLGRAVYSVHFAKHGQCYDYCIYRNKRCLTSTTMPVQLKENAKMFISERIMQQAFFEVNYEIEKLKL